jgi:hypothetical protein
MSYRGFCCAGVLSGRKPWILPIGGAFDEKKSKKMLQKSPDTA